MLAERGATVGIAARRADRLRETLTLCQEHAPASRMWVVDLSDVDAAVQLVHDAWDAFGGLDCLVNNAAVGKRKLVTDHTAEDLDVVMRTNFMSPIRMNLAVLPRMLERGSGTIVNVASGGGRFGIVHESAYCAAKFAVVGLTQVAAQELAPYVNVNAVGPGDVATEMMEREWEQEGQRRGIGAGDVKEEYRRRLLLGDFEMPREIARAIAFLCSPWANHITGSHLIASGGLPYRAEVADG